jgi:PHS family inorganic phosphate transporter-like MFS transporter
VWWLVSVLELVRTSPILHCDRGTNKIDYPLSSTLSAEKSPWGELEPSESCLCSRTSVSETSACIVFRILLRAFNSAIASDLSHLNWVWRLLLGIVIVLAALTLYARLTIAQTAQYKQCMRPKRCIWWWN